jgi:hypothetical protein
LSIEQAINQNVMDGSETKFLLASKSLNEAL